jgi:hypothetical protein
MIPLDIQKIAEGDNAMLISDALGAYSVQLSRESRSRKWAGAQFAALRTDMRTRSNAARELRRSILVVARGGEL